MKTTDAAKGKWREILIAFDIDAAFLTGKHSRCPCTGEGDDRFRFSDQNGTGDYFCACSQGGKGGFGLLACKTGRSFKELAAEVDTFLGNKHDQEPRARTYAQQLRDIAKPTRRSNYLASRGLEMAPGLLWATGVEYRDDEGQPAGKYAAMLAPIVRDGEWQTYHVTYLDKGAKASVACPRKILPGGAIAGGGVELYPSAEEMGVAEGIETAIAAKILFDCPTHSALNAEMLGKWKPPSVAKLIHIFADNDANFAGHRGAYALAHRLKLMKVDVIVHFPPNLGDYNDILMAQSKAAA